MHRTVSALQDGFAQRRKMRVAELILSLYADVITVHGGSIWLGSLVRTLAPLGFSESQVRISVHRLAAAGRLLGVRRGRRMDYRLSTKEAAKTVDPKIYASILAPEWDGRWHLVWASVHWREQLLARGYVHLSGGLYVHPLSDSRLQGLLAGGAEAVIAWEAECMPAAGMKELCRRLWHAHGIDALEQDYDNLWACARRLQKSIAGRPPGPAACFQLRLLLIHEYRRLRQRDPHWPGKLLPPRWKGAAVYDLLRSLYQDMSNGSLDHIRANLEVAGGRLATPEKIYFDRFGGLRKRLGSGHE